jgi:hypothetical protein
VIFHIGENGGSTVKGENLSRSERKNAPDADDEKVLESIEDLRSEVRELRNMVNLLVDMIVNMEAPDEMEADLEGNMMGLDPLLKNGKYCM